MKVTLRPGTIADAKECRRIDYEAFKSQLQYLEAIAQFRKAAELRPPHTQPQPCKRCAASARRRSCRSSLFGRGFRYDHFPDQGGKARIVADQIPYRLVFVKDTERASRQAAFQP